MRREGRLVFRWMLLGGVFSVLGGVLYARYHDVSVLLLCVLPYVCIVIAIEVRRRRARKALGEHRALPSYLVTRKMSLDHLHLESNQVYIFVRHVGGREEEVRFVRFRDGSARLSRKLNLGYDNGPEAWRGAIRRLASEGFSFRKLGNRANPGDYVPREGEDDWEAMKRFFRALDL